MNLQVIALVVLMVACEWLCSPVSLRTLLFSELVPSYYGGKPNAPANPWWRGFVR